MGKKSIKRLGKIRTNLFLFSDFFYPLVKSFFPKKMYRYAFFGALNVVLDNILFIIFFYVVLATYAETGVVDLGIIIIKRHVFALLLTMPIIIMTGFLVMRYIVFEDSRKIGFFKQFYKYVIASVSSVILNYFFIRLFIEWANMSADISKIITSLIIILYSYFFQTRVTFRKR